MRYWTYSVVQDIRDGTGKWYVEGTEWEQCYDENGRPFEEVSEISDAAGPFETEPEAIIAWLRIQDRRLVG